MCIVFVSTSHPLYSLVLSNNRDEYVLRPTSRPHWWKHPTTGQDILSARDLQRPERSTWLAISRKGLLTALTNYQDTSSHGAVNSPSRRRGAVLMDWMAEPPQRSMARSLQSLYGENDGDLQNIGGFSLVCGKLRRHHDGFAVVSNRNDQPEDVVILSPDHRQAWGLTNTVFGKVNGWSKIGDGVSLFDKAVRADSEKEQHDQDRLIKDLFEHLSVDTLPRQDDMSLEGNMENIRKTVFVPLLGTKKQFSEMENSKSRGPGRWVSEEDLPYYRPPETGRVIFDTGPSGTQRQTVLLVDRDGNVTYIERALFDANGCELNSGDDDVKFQFKIEGWND